MTKRDSKDDEKIVTEAQKRFHRCEDWESETRARFLEDTKFCEGDSDNGYQWDSDIQKSRQADARPCLTINKTRQHCLQIVNDARQHKAAINVRPVGDGATYEAAKIFEGVVRHIEYISNATEAYESATWRQVTGGWGYWRVLTEFADDKSFDQEIYIRRVPDPLSVYLDPDIQQFDGSDANFGFVFRDLTREAYEIEFPNEDADDAQGRETLGSYQVAPIDGWDDKDGVRVAEYYRKSEKRDRLCYLADGTIVLKSDLGPDGYKFAKEQAQIVRERDTTRPEIEWFKIVGREIVDRGIWPGSYIPLVRVIGEETVIDGKLDRKGHTRALKDPQRMYNFWSSSATEHVALQSKTPYVAPLEAIEGLETYWNKANLENLPYLPYNSVNEQGGQIAAPQRSAPPQMAQAYLAGMHNAQQELMMASGQYQAQMGENENAKSGIAIQQRQRQGDNATYHYIDHLAQAIRFTGRILIDLIPKVYDTPRVIKIMAESGEQTEVHVQPDAKDPHQMLGPQLDEQGKPDKNLPKIPLTPEQAKAAQAQPDLAAEVETIFNPNVGKYFVQSDVGPSYGTKRQEQFNALTQITAQNPEVFKIAGDILMKSADFPAADELAERIKRAIPPQLLGTGPNPEVMQAQEQVKQLQNAIAQLNQQMGEKDQKIAAKDAENEVKNFDAETRRIAAMGAIDQDGLKILVRSMIQEMTGVDPLVAVAAHAHAEQAMMPGQAIEQPQTAQ